MSEEPRSASPGRLARLRGAVATRAGRRSASGVAPPEVVLVTRVDCGLCRRAEQLIAREAGDATVRVVDVDTDEQLVARYGVRVPVVLVDDVEVAELEVSPGQVATAVRAARRARALGVVLRSL